MRVVARPTSCSVGAPGSSRPTREAYIELQVGTRNCICLLDTGSDVTLLPLDIVKDYPTRECSIQLAAANGTTIPVIGEVTVPANLHGRSLEMTGYVTEHVAEVIVVLDWL